MLMSKMPMRQYAMSSSLLVSRPDAHDMRTATGTSDSALSFIRTSSLMR